MSTAHNPKPRPEVEMQPVNIPGTVAYFEIDDGSLMGAGILKGDKAVVLLDCEVQRDDLVLVHVVGEGLRVLRYHTAPGGRVKLSTMEFARSRQRVYKRDAAVVLGRVVQVQYGAGKVAQTLVPLRPIY